EPRPADDPPLRIDPRDGDVPRLAGEVHLAVGGDRRAVVVARPVEPPLLLQLAGAGVEDGEEPGVARQVQPAAVVQRRRDHRQVLLLRPEHVRLRDVALTAGPDRHYAVLRLLEALPAELPLGAGDVPVLVAVEHAEALFRRSRRQLALLDRA